MLAKLMVVQVTLVVLSLLPAGRGLFTGSGEVTVVASVVVPSNPAEYSVPFCHGKYQDTPVSVMLPAPSSTAVAVLQPVQVTVAVPKVLV